MDIIAENSEYFRTEKEQNRNSRTEIYNVWIKQLLYGLTIRLNTLEVRIHALEDRPLMAPMLTSDKINYRPESLANERRTIHKD